MVVIRIFLWGTLAAALMPVFTPVFAATAHLDSVLSAQNDTIATLYTEGQYTAGVELVHEYLADWASSLGSDSKEYCSMASNLGPLLSMAGEMDAAEVAHREGIACLRETFGAESEDLASALNNYGSYLGKAADLGRAELALEESIRLLRLTLGEDHFYVAITLNNLGVNQQNQGNYVAAERTMREAVDRLRTSLGAEHSVTATAINNLGRLLGARGDFEAAEPLLREALTVRLAQLGHEHRDTSIGKRDLGRLLSRQGRYEEAEPHLREALAAFIQTLGDDHPEVAMSHHELGRVLVRLQRYDEAQAELTLGLELSQNLYQDGHASHIQIHSELGEIAFLRGDMAAANQSYLAATSSYEVGRKRSGQGLSRATYLDSPWLALAAVRLELGDPEGAWDALELAQGRVLEEEMPNSEHSSDDMPHLSTGTAMIGWLDLDFVSEPRSWAWLHRDGNVRWYRLNEQAESNLGIVSFRDRIAEPGSLGSLRELAYQVWQERFLPLELDLDGLSHVVVVSSGGSMLGVPIGALVDDQKRWLADRWTFSYAPSAGVYNILHKGDSSEPGPALFVGDPELKSNVTLAANFRRPSDEVIRGASHGLRESIDALPSLPGTREEVQSLSASWDDSTILLGGDASEPNLSTMAAENKLKNFKVLHFATHALVDGEDADASALVFSQTDLPDPLETLASGEKIYDGLVTTREIREGWRLDADLVTLSACNSALGQTVTGEGLVGFAHAFLGSGARSTLVSQWSVPDLATMLFMNAFYEAWRNQQMSRVQALAFAQTTLRSHQSADGRLPYKHPYYWAPFVLVGDDR